MLERKLIRSHSIQNLHLKIYKYNVPWEDVSYLLLLKTADGKCPEHCWLALGANCPLLQNIQRAMFENAAPRVFYNYLAPGGISERSIANEIAKVANLPLLAVNEAVIPALALESAPPPAPRPY